MAIKMFFILGLRSYIRVILSYYLKVWQHNVDLACCVVHDIGCTGNVRPDNLQDIPVVAELSVHLDLSDGNILILGTVASDAFYHKLPPRSGVLNQVDCAEPALGQLVFHFVLDLLHHDGGFETNTAHAEGTVKERGQGGDVHTIL